MEHLYCIQIWCTSFALVAMYVPYTLISLFKPSSADNNKTTVGTYAPMMILRTSPTMPQKNCGLPTRWIHRFRKSILWRVPYLCHGVLYLVTQTCSKLNSVLLTVLQLGVYLSIINTLLTKEDGDKYCKGDRRRALGFVNLLYALYDLICIF